MDTASRFAGRSLCIATMHGKEAAIAPVLQQRLGVRCVLPPDDFDSDRFGTFSGEVPPLAATLPGGAESCSISIEFHDPQASHRPAHFA